MEHGFSWFRISCLVIALLALYAVRIYEPKVRQDVADVKALQSPTVVIKRTPLTGCSVSRLNLDVGWQ